jgi:VIT1/CCC1 family predicted Fe2+/Mn2+ transporter
VYSVSTRGSATVVHCTRLRKLRCACSNASIATEADELEEVPGEEKEELSLIYQAKGLPEDLAKSLAEQLITNKKTALDTLVREELGIDPEELGGSAWAAGGTSFLLFALGAIFPVAPYFALVGMPAVIASLAASGAGRAL